MLAQSAAEFLTVAVGEQRDLAVMRGGRGRQRLLPPSSHVKASIGRIALLLFGIPRCQSIDDRMITSPALAGMRIAGIPEEYTAKICTRAGECRA